MYCTVDDLKKLLPETVLVQLTDDEDLDVINQDRVDEAIATAEEEVNAFCSARYTVPFTDVPGVVTKCAADIAIYNLYSRTMEEIPQARTDRYKNAIRLLEGIAKGVISIGVSPEPTAKAEGTPACNKTTNDRVFTRDTMEGL